MPNKLRRSKRESARIAYQDIRRREREKQQEVEKEQIVERQHIGPSKEALEITRKNRCQHGILKHFTDCSSPSPQIETVVTPPQINATHITTIGLAAITSTLAPLIVQPFNANGKLLTNDTDNIAYNTTLQASSNELFNNMASPTEYSPISLSAGLLYAGGTVLLVGTVASLILGYKMGCYSWPPSCFRKENNEESRNSYSQVESVDNLNEAEKGLLPSESSTPKAEAKKPHVSFALAERTTGNNKNRHQFYKSSPSSHSNSDTQRMDYGTPRHSNS